MKEGLLRGIVSRLNWGGEQELDITVAWRSMVESRSQASRPRLHPAVVAQTASLCVGKCVKTPPGRIRTRNLVARRISHVDERETVRLSERVWDNLQRVSSVSPLGGPGEQVTSRGSMCCRDTQREKHKTT